ncbi:MAG TPA: DUF4190 domain-containing protein [Jatrophihabitantaceae bacterium]|jgi:succinate-acetate transporter protein|nr:DUF4190 domain-containing protein [Jatrophihabitantaceae bacterium]
MSTEPDDNPPRAYPRPADPAPNSRPDGEQAEYNVFAIISVSCGILGLVMLQIVLAPLAIIFGALGVHAARDTGPDTRRLAVAGYSLGILDGIIWLVLASVFHLTFFPL